MTVGDFVIGVLGGIAVLCGLGSAYWYGRAEGIREAERRRFWTERGEQP